MYATDVAVRWSDMDRYGHVNNAQVVTLLEEARTELLFGGAQGGAQTLADGVVVVELRVSYRQPLVYTAKPVRVRLWVSELRAASFTLDYVVVGTSGAAVTARTKLAAYDTAAQRPRRLTPKEREFLAVFQDDGSDGAAESGEPDRGVGG